jgi:hypothetical protein
MFPPVFATACIGEPRVVNFASIAWQATQPRDVTARRSTRTSPTGAHGATSSRATSPGTSPAARSCTRLEISCTGHLFDPDGNPAVRLFDSPACRARYARPQAMAGHQTSGK